MATQVKISETEQKHPAVQDKTSAENQKAKQDAAGAKVEVIDQFERHRREFFGK